MGANLYFPFGTPDRRLNSAPRRRPVNVLQPSVAHSPIRECQPERGCQV